MTILIILAAIVLFPILGLLCKVFFKGVKFGVTLGIICCVAVFAIMIPLFLLI